MKKIDVRKVVVGLAAVSMMCVMPARYAYGQEDGSTSSPSKTFTIKVTYLEGEKIIPNAEVYFLYYDRKASALVDKTANTGDGKTVHFDIPLDDEGASYPFIVLFSTEDVAKAKKRQADGSLSMYRKPPGMECDFLELQIQKGGGSSNQGCAIQIWNAS
jgi:hypothetical protein